MLPTPSTLAASIILLVSFASASSKVAAPVMEDRSKILEGLDVEGTARRERRRAEPPRRESSAEELAAAVASPYVDYHRDTGSYASEQPRQAAGYGWRDSVPGTPGVDYPNLMSIPVTSFSCAGKEPGGYYADVETGCQVFHVCNVGGVKSSFLCSPGSIFNQKYSVCDWWYGVSCGEAPDTQEEKFSRVVGQSEEPSYQTPEFISDVTRTFNDNSRKYYLDENERSYSSPLMALVRDNGERRVDEVSRYQSDDRHSQDNATLDDNTPKAFSRDNFYPKGGTHRTTVVHGLTNDLASYINDAYFEAGMGDNGKDNEDDDEEQGGDVRINFSRNQSNYSHTQI